MKCDIGHFEIKAGERCYNLIPSFENMMKLGSPSDLVNMFKNIHSFGKYENLFAIKSNYMTCVLSAIEIIRACSDEDPSDILVSVEPKHNGLSLVMGDNKLPVNDMVIIASGLMRHGVAGATKDDKKSKGEPATEIDLWEFAYIAMSHLGMSKLEALSLTMTEFVRIMEIKFPSDKNSAKNISDEEYEASMQMMNRNRIARGEEEWQLNH